MRFLGLGTSCPTRNYIFHVFFNWLQSRQCDIDGTPSNIFKDSSRSFDNCFNVSTTSLLAFFFLIARAFRTRAQVRDFHAPCFPA
uniref:Secreted protein n=1 Tax=Steinernema glaseri TaxID=37863 RepID=A0A1I7YH18_9BILA